MRASQHLKLSLFLQVSYFNITASLALPEFKAVAQNGMLKIPDEYSEWYNQSLKVILLVDSLKNVAKKSPSTGEIQAFFAAKQVDLQDYKF